MKVISRLIFITTIVVLSCSDDNDSLESRTALLVDVYWYNSDVIGTTPSGYIVVSPIVFRRDKTVFIGGTKSNWTFIENGRSIKITSQQTNYFNKYEIINLTETEFHFKHYDGSEQFAAELIYRPR